MARLNTVYVQLLILLRKVLYIQRTEPNHLILLKKHVTLNLVKTNLAVAQHVVVSVLMLNLLHPLIRIINVEDVKEVQLLNVEKVLMVTCLILEQNSLHLWKCPHH